MLRMAPQISTWHTHTPTRSPTVSDTQPIPVHWANTHNERISNRIWCYFRVVANIMLNSRVARSSVPRIPPPLRRSRTPLKTFNSFRLIPRTSLPPIAQAKETPERWYKKAFRRHTQHVLLLYGYSPLFSENFEFANLVALCLITVVILNSTNTQQKSTYIGKHNAQVAPIIRLFVNGILIVMRET